VLYNCRLLRLFAKFESIIFQDGHFAYSHRMRPGVNRDSHGLKVAQLAGMPESAVAIAKEALSWMRDADIDRAITMAELAVLGQTLTVSRPQKKVV